MQSNCKYNKGQPPFIFLEELEEDTLVDKIVQSILDAPNKHENNEDYLYEKSCNELITVMNQPDADAKSTRVSLDCREVGNMGFKMNKLNKAWEVYTMSIAHAPPGSLELSLAYANRSAVLFKAKWMTDCLVDIERALSLNYPNNLKAKLYLRQANCHQALNPQDRPPIDKALDAARQWLKKMNDKNKETMKKLLKEHETLEPAEKINCYKVDFEDIPPKLTAENPTIPGLSDAVELVYSDKYGRHCVATRDIKPGEIIGVQKSYVNVVVLVERYKLCWHCKKQAWSSIPCDGCAEVIYCSSECRDKAHVEYHDIECYVLRRVFAFGAVDDEFLISLRLTIKALKEAGNSLDVLKKNISKIDGIADPMEKVLAQDKLYPDKFESICCLTVGHLPDISSYHTYSMVINILMGYLIIKSHNISEKKSEDLNILKEDDLFLFFVKFISKNTARSGCNGLGISIPCGKENFTKISHAITPSFAFFNHSCVLMVNRKQNGDYLVITSLCPIKKGEQISENYFVNFMIQEKSVRQAHLSKFKFVCDCKACLDDWPTLATLHSKLPRSQLKKIMSEYLKYTAEAMSLNDSICEFVRCNNRLQNVTKEIVNLSKHVEKTHRLFKNNSLQVSLLTQSLSSTISLSQMPLFSLD